VENLLPQSKQIQPKLLMSLINQIQHLQRKKEIHPRVSLPARYIFVNLIQSVTWNKLETFAKYSLETIQSQNSCPRFRHTTTLRTKHVEIHRCKSAQRDLSCRVKRFSMLLVVSRTSMQPPRLLCWCHRIKWSMGKCCVGAPPSPSKGLMATHWLARFQRMASPTVALEAISKVGFPESVASVTSRDPWSTSASG
jgi:hypothetical protein